MHGMGSASMSFDQAQPVMAQDRETIKSQAAAITEMAAELRGIIRETQAHLYGLEPEKSGPQTPHNPSEDVSNLLDVATKILTETMHMSRRTLNRLV